MGPFGDAEVRLDPWQPDFGAEAPGLAAPEEVPAVEVDVERPADGWGPIAPAGVEPPRRLVFVDGVRRVEARIVVRRGGARFLGAFGSWAVGGVAVEDGRATFLAHALGRVVALGSGAALDDVVPVAPGLRYRPVSTADPGPDGPVRAIHADMRLAEGRLATTLADAPDAVVIGDGPLTWEAGERRAAIGYVKRIVQLYLPPAQAALLATLPPGARTPLFRFAGRFARYGWFLRLAAPRRGDSDTSGLVRMEVSAEVGLARARALADQCAAAVPRFASVRGLHARAPQNLLPIGALEEQLHRRLGDVEVVHRRIQAFVAAEAR